MKNWQKFLALFSIFMVTCSMIFAQVQIRGQVSDEEGNPLPGVNIIIEGTTVGTITDLEGSFNIQAEVGQRLMIRFIGMQVQLIEITSANEFLTVTLQEDITALEEVVVVGYGTQKKQSVVGAIATASGEDIHQQGNVTNLKDAITGMIPGVSVLSISGLPGGGGEAGYTASQILVRGMNTWNNAYPLILVDGVERSMDEVDINEVENVSVLKDASATSVFGVKGGNGVILITTKRGRVGKTRFNIEAEMSSETPSKLVEREDTYESAIARNYAVERIRRFNTGLWDELYYADQELEYFENGQLPYAYANQDWSDIMLKDWSRSYRINATARGGTERVQYFTSFTYNHTGDIYRNEDIGQGYIAHYAYDRLNIRTNFDFDITETTRLSADFSGMYGLQSVPRAGGGINNTFEIFNSTPGNSPIYLYEDGTPGADDGRFNATNPYYYYNYNGMTYNPRTQINMTYSLTQKLDFVTSGLSFSAKLAYDDAFNNNGGEIRNDREILKYIDKRFYLNGGYYDYDTETYMLDGSPANMGDWTSYQLPFTSGPEGFGWVKEPNTYQSESVSVGSSQRVLYYQMQLLYNRSFEKHGISAMAIFSRQKSESGSNWPHKREDWAGRITYDYDGRYLLEVNGAYNGSEKFGPEYRFDFFPSVAGGWVISNESFIKNGAPWLNNLKLRYSYGLVGNDNVNTGSTWPYLTVWGTYSNSGFESSYYGYPFGYKEYGRYEEGNPGNPDLRWEKATKQNLGLDFAAFNNMITITAEVFKEYREDMLLAAGARTNTVPPLFGKAPPPANIGEAKSHGAELDITFHSSPLRDFRFWINWNWSVARSEVIYKESTDLTLPHQKPEGKPLNQTYSGISTGFIDSWDDLYCATGASDAASNYYLLPGDLIMLDFNSDGRYYGTEDNVPYAYPTYPQNNYGISIGANYKGIDFTMRLVGAYNTTRGISIGAFPSDNLFVPTYLLGDTWTPEYNNADPTYPALALATKTYNPTGAFFQQDGSFIRLQSVEMGYSLPQRWTEPLRINNLKLYVNGRNLFLLTKMPTDGVGFDEPARNYPTKKQINIGLRIQL